MVPSLKLRAILFPFQMEPRREELLQELGEMWDEIGEAEDDRRGVLRLLEEECLNVYRAKVEQVRHHRAQLKRDIADSVAEVAAICATIGEPPATVQTACSSLKGTGSLREELGSIAPELAEMRRRRDERRREILDVAERVNRVRQEIGGQPHDRVAVDGSDLTLARLEELRAQLHRLQTEREDRARRATELRALLRSSSLVLGMDPRRDDLCGGDISDGAIATLAAEIERLRGIKRDRMHKLQDLVGTMLELWNLMDTPSEEQGRFQSVACNIAASEDEITEPDTLSVDSMHHVEAEVLRLESLKARRMKDLVLKKHEELKQIRRRARLPEADAAVDSGSERSLMILERLEAQISEARDLEYSRKDVLERMERWQAALDEESWLEEYSRNENRYNVGKGTHLVLKRAEKARALASKMPAMVEALTAKVAAWEKERGTRFEYDGERLLDLLEEYSNTRKEKEQERKRQRDQRRLQGPGGGERDASSPKNIKNVTRTLSMGGRKAPSSSRPGTPSFLKSSPAAVRRGGSDDGQMLSDSFE